MPKISSNSEKVLIHERITARFDCAEDFKSEFGSRAPDVATIKNFFQPDPSAFVCHSSTTAKMAQCLDVGNRFHDTYHNIRQSLDANAEGNGSASELVGDYVFYRPDLGGKITSGGLRLYRQHDLDRFWHFNSIRKFRDFRQQENKDQGDEASDKLTERLLSIRKPASDPRPSHKGYFYKQDGRLTMAAMDTTYFRTIMGVAPARSDLSQAYLRIIVLARARGGAIFSAKAFMIHHSNERFSRKFTEEEICEVLGINKPSDGLLTFT